MSKGPGQDAFKDFAKSLKDTLCKDPKSGKVAKDAEVRMHSCWSGDNVNQDHSVGEELSKAGITSWGYQGVCTFPYSTAEGDDKIREYKPPEEASKGEFKKFDAPKEEDKPKEKSAPKKK